MSTFWDSEDFMAWSQPASCWLESEGFFLREGGTNQVKSLHIFIWFCRAEVYFCVHWRKRNFYRHTLCFANQPLPSFWLPLLCKGFAISNCLLYISTWVSCRRPNSTCARLNSWGPSSCLLILLIPLFLLPASLTSQSTLLETSEWPLILPGVSSHLTNSQVPQTLLAQYLSHTPLPSVPKAAILAQFLFPHFLPQLSRSSHLQCSSYILPCPRPIFLMNNMLVRIRLSFHPAGKKKAQCLLPLRTLLKSGTHYFLSISFTRIQSHDHT